MKKIIFTGGGSGGHVTLNLNLIPLFQKDGWQVVYIGSEDGIEKELVTKISGVRYYAIRTGKLRRYFSWQNFKDALKVPVGIIQAALIIHREKPDIIFSKGGFVSFPVVVGGFLNRCKIFMHESDVTPGLANKMSLPFVTKFFTTFQSTEKYVRHKEKIRYLGPVLSDRLENGDTAKALGMCHFLETKPVIMFVGGSLGAKSINTAVRQNLKSLLEYYQIIHICGKGQTDDTKALGYAQFDFVDKEFKDLLAITDMVVSRSGSNAIFEFWSQAKPMLLVPLPSTSSRGEQMLNALDFKERGFAEIIRDDELLLGSKFISMIHKVDKNREQFRHNMMESDLNCTNNQDLYKAIIEDESV